MLFIGGHDIRSCAAGKSMNCSIGQETTSLSCAGNFWGIEGQAGHDICVVCEGGSLSLSCTAYWVTT